MVTCWWPAMRRDGTSTTVRRVPATRQLAAGVALSAIEQATQMACIISLQTGTMTGAEAERRFSEDLHFAGAAARASADARARGRERDTWGKQAIRAARERKVGRSPA